MRRVRRGVVCATALLVPAAAQAEGARVEVPIRAVVLSDGAKRYSVDLMIDGVPVTAGLDTGSTGLRVLARALPAELQGARGSNTKYSYSSGVGLDGTVVRTAIGFGALPAGTVPIERVDSLFCTSRDKDCAASRVDPARFGIQGDGLPGEGFAAILGIGMKDDQVPNPLPRLDTKRWIVELPRPGDAVPGRLILNPDAADVAGFRMMKMIAGENTIAGCFTSAPTGRVCGPARLDSGAPGIRIVAARVVPPVPPGTAATLAIGDGGDIAQINVTIGRREQASGFSTERRDTAQLPQLFFGIAPYLRWAVLYDAASHMLGMKPRDVSGE